ncbi:MAG: hypothetical protein AMJ90_09755 [candidate division Zixibacteria bacterium SM23_73_2]|nr:MAG: hypothetical protein AMJ90_09755 [candidate division Zixibacteria bacterium SM23_73_2]
MRFFKRIVRDESGVTAVVVALSLVMIFAFAVLTIDLGFVQLARTQLQNAADAAALAGASALAASNGDQSVAIAEAKNFAAFNVAVQDKDRSVVITDSCVTFPEPTKVRVLTHRTHDTGDPVGLHFLKVINPLKDNEANITATATAAVLSICGPKCLRPFCPPDRWDDADSNGIWTPDDEYNDLNTNGLWDPGEPLIEDYNGNGVWDPEEFYDPYLTGYRAPDDIGVQVTLHLLNSNNDFKAEWYYSVRFPPINSGESWDPGADIYRELIEGDRCEPFSIGIVDQLALEPGGMVGPTNQGLDALIAKDPTAEWDPVTKTIINSAYPVSPRIVLCAAFNPTYGVDSGPPKYVTVAKVMALFVEGHVGADIVGRFMRAVAEGDPDPDCPGGFLYNVCLVE